MENGLDNRHAIHAAVQCAQIFVSFRARDNLYKITCNIYHQVCLQFNLRLHQQEVLVWHVRRIADD